MPRLAVLGQPISHSRCRRCRTPRSPNSASPTSGAMRRSVAPRISRTGSLARRCGLRRGQRHRPAQARGAGGCRPRLDRRERDRRREHITFTDAGIEAENTDADGLIAALPEPPAGAGPWSWAAGGSARAAVWALGNAGGSVSVWNRTAARARRWRELGVSPTSAAASVASRCRWPTTTCWSTAPRSASRRRAPRPRHPAILSPLPLRADALQATQIVVDLAYGSSATPLIAAASSRGARSSTASRSSSSREPPRCGSGPAWTRRWRRCGARHAEVEQQVAPDKHSPRWAVRRPRPSAEKAAHRHQQHDARDGAGGAAPTRTSSSR